jgi:AcrR family transcriptional regulator
VPASDRLPTRSNKKAERLDEILTVAAEEFRRRGYAQCTLTDIGDRLGMHKASLYYYVSSKEDLLERAILRGTTELRAAVEQASTTDDPLDRFERIVRVHGTTLLEHPDVFGLLVEQRSLLDPAVLDRIGAHERRYVGAVRQVLDELDEAGRIEAGDPRLRLRVTMDMMNGIVRWHPPGGDIDASVEFLWRRIAGSLGLRRRRRRSGADHP